MTGSALIDFVITLVVLVGTGALFFIAIDKAAPDPMMNRIGKIAIGVVLAVVILLAIKGLLFGGSALALTGGGIITFAIGVIVILVLLFLVDLVFTWLGAQVGEPIMTAIRYLVFAIALIALLVLADHSFFGGRYIGSSVMGDTPSIIKPERR